jgi:hypothetical protein
MMFIGSWRSSVPASGSMLSSRPGVNEPRSTPHHSQVCSARSTPPDRETCVASSTVASSISQWRIRVRIPHERSFNLGADHAAPERIVETTSERIDAMIEESIRLTMALALPQTTFAWLLVMIFAAPCAEPRRVANDLQFARAQRSDVQVWRPPIPHEDRRDEQVALLTCSKEHHSLLLDSSD